MYLTFSKFGFKVLDSQAGDTKALEIIWKRKAIKIINKKPFITQSAE